MRTNSLLRPLVVIAASFSVMGSAFAATFGNFTYTSDGTSVTITGHANVATPSLVIPVQINGVPVRSISSLADPNLLGNALKNSVTSVTIPEGVTSIGDNAFSQFILLTSITIPNSVTSIGNYAIGHCTSLTSATFGNGVTSLYGTFVGCSKLASVDLPDNLVSLNYAFQNCTSLTQIQIPASVTGFENTFIGCSGLTSVVLPPGLVTLDQNAFANCTSLQSVTLPSGLVTIGLGAFSFCTSLTSIALPSSLKTIKNGAFFGSGLTSLALPAGLTTIENGAFDSCSGLTSLTVPNSVTEIGDNAFWRCPNLTEVNLPSRFLASIGNIGLDYKPEIASNTLVTGIANSLANSPGFVSKLADTIIAKNGHYGLATQSNLSTLADEVPQLVSDALAEANAGAPVARGITSDLGTLTVKKGKAVTYATTTSFGATAFAAIGLPDGVVIDATTGAISGKPKKAGTFNVFLHAGIPGGGSVSAVKVISVTP